jgi:hypothetical protein
MKASLATTPARSVIVHLNGRSLNKVSRLDLVKPSTDPPLAARGTFGLGAAAQVRHKHVRDTVGASEAALVARGGVFEVLPLHGFTVEHKNGAKVQR